MGNISNKIAVEFVINDYSDDFIFLYPKRLVIGELDEKTALFTDSLTNDIIVNSDTASYTGLPIGFNCVVSVNLLKKAFKTRNVKDAINKYWDSIKNNVFYYYQGMGYNLETTTKDNFIKQYGFDPTLFDPQNLLNKMIKALVTDEYDELTDEKNDEKTKDLKDVFLETPISAYENEIKKKVLSQDEAIRKLIVAIYKSKIFPGMKANVLMYGPTGVGKTEIVKNIGNLFDVPVHIEDMSQFSAVGYRGNDINSILENLYYNADEDIEKAEQSILVLDEIDKKANNDDAQSSISKADVLKELLKIIEGGKFNVSLSNHDVIEIDTSNLVVIACGAFSDILDNNFQKKSVGFNALNANQKPITRELKTEDFVKYGVPVEFIGRFNTIIKMNSLSKEDFIKILKEGELSNLKRYIEGLNKLGVNTKVEDALAEKIAERAISLKTGARALNSVTDECFENVLYEIFNNPDELEDLEIENITDKGYVLKRRSEIKSGS